jgi:hypothetical protein
MRPISAPPFQLPNGPLKGVNAGGAEVHATVQLSNRKELQQINHHEMKFQLALLLCIAMTASGCATTTKYPYDDTWQEQTSNFRIVDQRPEVEKTPEIMSVSLQSEKYGEYRLGDAQLAPERIAYLRGQLLTIDPVHFEGKIAHLRHFEIFNKLGGAHRNGASALAFTAAAGGAGLVAVTPVISKAADATPVDQWPRIEIYVEMEMEGNTYSSTQRIPYHGLNENKNMRYPVHALKMAMQGAAQNIAAKAKKE